MIKLYADEFHAPSLRLHLVDGNIVKINTEGDQIEKILFQEYDFPVFSAEMASTMLDKDSMKTNAELIQTIATRQNNRAASLSLPSSNRKNKTGNRAASPAKSSNAQRNTAQTTLIPIFLSSGNNKRQILFNINLAKKL